MSPILFAAALAAVAPHAPRPDPDPVARWRPIVAEASARFGIPGDWIERVIRSESAGLTTIAGNPIRSRTGAMGLMQLMPATWSMMRATYHLGADPDDPHDNIIAGTAFLRLMQDRFGYPGLFGAYSAGPSRYADYLSGRSRLPAETIAYVARMTRGSPTAAATAAAPQRQFLFTIRHAGDGDQSSSDGATADGLFAIRPAHP